MQDFVLKENCFNTPSETRHNPYKFEYSVPYFLADEWGSKMHVAARARKGVLFIGINENGIFKPLGTGFIVSAKSHGRAFLHLVTAKHVIDGIRDIDGEVYIRFNKKGGGYEINVAPAGHWHFHPDTESFIDVAVAPFHLPTYADYTHARIEGDFLTQEIINNLSVNTGDDVFITGLFVSHHGEGKNVPIVRIGNIAAMPEEPVWTKYGYMDAYLIESRSIGGLSGSPVYFQPAPLRIIDGVVTQTTETSRTHYLLGLVHGHFDVKDTTDIVQDESEYAKTSKLHSGIAIVVPSEKIIETINQEAIMKMRKETIKKAMAESDAVSDVAEEETDITGDKILENMLNTPPETHEEMKEK